MKKVLVTLVVALLAGNAIEIQAFKKVQKKVAPVGVTEQPPVEEPTSKGKRALTAADKQAILDLAKAESWDIVNAEQRYNQYLREHDIAVDDVFLPVLNEAVLKSAQVPELTEDEVEVVLFRLAHSKSKDDIKIYLNGLEQLIKRIRAMDFMK